MQIFNTRAQAVEEADMSVDANNEIVGTFKDGGIVKFPAGLTQAQFDKAIAEHQTANEGQDIITPEKEAAAAKARAASEALIGVKTHDTSEPQPE